MTIPEILRTGLTRRQCLATAAALPLVTMLPRRAHAAEFTYKLATGQDPSHPVNKRAQEAIDTQKAEALTKKIMAGKFTLHEMYEQIEMLTDMGPMRKLASLIPGVGGKMKDADMENTQARLRRFKIIMDSMTDDEMKDPKLVKSSRVQRIARGAGVAPRDVKELLRNYEMSRKAIKGFAGNRKMRKQLLQQLEASGVDLDKG